MNIKSIKCQCFPHIETSQLIWLDSMRGQHYRMDKLLSHFWIKNLFNPLSAKPTKWSHTHTETIRPTNCLSVLDHFVVLVFEEL